MSDSILNTVKKKLGLAPSYDVFDLDIQTHINGVFMTLHQLGIGPADGFAIEDEETEWNTFLSPGIVLSAVKSYMYLRVRMLFDPPQTSFHLDSIKEQIKEYEWRLNVYAEDSFLETSRPIVVPVAPVPSAPDPVNPGPIVVDADGGGA